MADQHKTPKLKRNSSAAADAVPASILNRKGARNTAAVSADVRALLNAGLIESVNLCEWLIVDHERLAENVFPELGWQSCLPQVSSALKNLKTPTALKKTFAVGKILAQLHTSKTAAASAFESLRDHSSDTVRTWACALIGQKTAITLAEKLSLLQPLAADPNMGVREIAWMAARPLISQQLPEAIQLLSSWVQNKDERIRRFASEATRPRGVWCAHIKELKESPELALSLLVPLRSDESKYVRDSVANWLNDASKSRPDFVRQTCQTWLSESPTPATQAIVKRALRTLKKNETLGAFRYKMTPIE